MVHRLGQIIRTTKRNAGRWVAESPSTRDRHLIWYQLKKSGLRWLWAGQYDENFFADQENLKSAYKELSEIIFQQFRPVSVCDFGCGNGFLLSYLAKKGVEASGVEGSSAALKFIDPTIRDRIVVHDLTQPIDTGLHDLVISTEVAEHLPKKAAAQFVQNLVRSSSKTIVFTAAKPGQWGDGHINCQPQEFWIRLFTSVAWRHDSVASQRLTTAVKESSLLCETVPWIVNNFMVFVPDDTRPQQA